MKTTDQVIINSVKSWFEDAVLGLNLCPFAHSPYQRGAIAFELSHAKDDLACLSDLYLSLLRMDRDDTVETLVRICPNCYPQFTDYNQFLTLADHLLEQEGWSGVYQIASFHPDYRFSGTRPDDRSNWTNRSPFPLLHIIREESVSRAVAGNASTEQKPERNCQRLQQMNDTEMVKVFGSRYRSRF